ncbi:16S rRNA methyltransferase [Salinisphaera orenii MK-B5]|uniref:16S rRNA (cytosine(967)-C(5))-methyltransferase n=1 Tax=Salinisphaera orenii MK-B5 TaxID=856730 RepID=A0A423PG49_9GAMM|nr:16S rRNA (cytosine(967)-C(5))-methyltransferase RsmB [Salinisphaera orenii]ROO24629.1 16S rRNA methyltransferase [Salinisphaera orenii MK-B5]
MSDAAAGSAPRAAAARAVSAVIDGGRSLDAALAEAVVALSAADRGLAAAMAFGTLREHRRLAALIAPRLKRRPQPLLHALLLVGVHQLEAMRVPPHAAVHASVAATRALGLSKARGLVNAVLRGFQRDGAPAVGDAPGLRYSHPDWLVDAIRADWPQAWTSVLAANNAQAPMHLRVNARRIDREAYRAVLAEAGFEAVPTPHAPDGLTLDTPVAVAELPGFAAGDVSIQDGAAQLAADLVDPVDGERVLDACAAPGNKTAHLLERAAADVLALDVDGERVATLEATLTRLGLAARTRTADARAVDSWWDGRAFDAILLDAPCSGTGVIRRHPDIKWLRRPTDIAAAAERQGALLDALWPTLAPGGRLVYATCSILAAEGADPVAAFIARQPDAHERPIAADWGEPAAAGRRLAPGAHGFDGFYYAVLERRPD